jgi:hypothetical protein
MELKPICRGYEYVRLERRLIASLATTAGETVVRQLSYTAKMNILPHAAGD